jgi:hypothetical protein
LHAAECQQLPGQRGSAIGGAINLFIFEGAYRSGNTFRRNSVWPLMTIKRLLKSWATPPAGRITSIFAPGAVAFKNLAFADVLRPPAHAAAGVFRL